MLFIGLFFHVRQITRYDEKCVLRKRFLRNCIVTHVDVNNGEYNFLIMNFY